MNWFSQITQNISKIPDAIAYYETELEVASHEVKLHGNIEKQSATMPGVVESRLDNCKKLKVY